MGRIEGWLPPAVQPDGAGDRVLETVSDRTGCSSGGGIHGNPRKQAMKLLCKVTAVTIIPPVRSTLRGLILFRF